MQWSFTTSSKVKVGLLLIIIGIMIAMLILRASPKTDCTRIEGATYRSSREVDNFFGGTMQPQVSFSHGRFMWVYTDMVIGGVYECQSGRIVADGVTVQLDPRTGDLLWNGDWYVRGFP